MVHRVCYLVVHRMLLSSHGPPYVLFIHGPQYVLSSHGLPCAVIYGCSAGVHRWCPLIVV